MTYILCGHCGGEREVEVTQAYTGCGPSRWEPAESPEYDVAGLDAPCEDCGHDLDTPDNWTAAIDAALSDAAERDDRRTA